MSSTYVNAELRRIVITRAEGLCEYCLLHEEDTFIGCQIDHVISEKHGGLTQADNLAYACLFCNLHKGSDIATFIPGTQTLVRFFHPRIDQWNQHFLLDADGITLLPLTEIGEATIRMFGFNQEERLLERQALRSVGRYPTAVASKRMRSAD
jgi:HNH endonuclease